MSDLKHHKYLWRTALCAAAAILAVGLYAGANSSSFWRTVGLAAVTALAAFWSVGLVGFLFGLPPAEEGVSNQSLSQVSDWLTKIILGATLVQLRAIGSFIWDVGTQLGSTAKLAAGAELFTALIVASGATGFVFFYFWAYMYWDRLREDAKVKDLKTLERLRRDGVVGDDEFQQRRARMLDSIR